MSKQKGTTKTGSLTSQFKASAVNDPDGALATMFLAAFGVSLLSLMSVADRAIAGKDMFFIRLCLTAGVQIRAHVVFVGATTKAISTTYPEVVITGNRDVSDQFNFGALHALGHMLAHLANSAMGNKIISKAGSCITGEKATDTDAGKINAEIKGSWAISEAADWAIWNSTNAAEYGSLVNEVLNNMEAKAKSFQAPAVGARPKEVKKEGI